MPRRSFAALLIAVARFCLHAQGADNVLLVVNDASPFSQSIGEYYAKSRDIPAANVCHIRASIEETIGRIEYDRNIAAPIAVCLKVRGLTEKILYIVTTSHIPLRIEGTEGLNGTAASVDSELTLLYSDLHGRPHPLAGPLANPFFDKLTDPFGHPQYPMYLVSRLAGYRLDDVKAIIDRAIAPQNRGKFVIDLTANDNAPGNDWLRSAAALLPKHRVILDDTPKVLENQREVIGYASWGSNDPQRKLRTLGFEWLPGAIMTEYVSTNARTFRHPPTKWNLGIWDEPEQWFAGSPQTLTADYIREGVTGASGHVYEPYLAFTPRPDYLLPAYYQGRNLAESYYLAIPALSWQNIVVGDPLCSLGKPTDATR